MQTEMSFDDTTKVSGVILYVDEGQKDDTNRTPQKGEKMKYIVEFYEEGTSRFRAVRVECDNQEYAHVEAMRQGAEIGKLLAVYPDKPRKGGQA